jgi:FkbM family methyltransferase
MKDIVRSLFRNRLGEWLLRGLVSGMPYGKGITRIVPNHYSYKKGSFRRILRNNLLWNLDISDMMEWFVYFGFAEPARDLLLDQVKPGMHVADVGANAGMVTLPVSKLVGQTGMVYSFEPIPETFDKLKSNVSVNSLANVELYPFALGERSCLGEAGFEDTGNSGTTAILPGKDGTGIRIEPLDDLYLAGKIKRLDLIKIDVEGFEYNVLLGAAKVIEQFKPILFIEFNTALIQRIGNDPACLVKMLYDWGYRLFDASSGETFDFREENNYHTDLLARIEVKSD